jgi:Helicase associated domain
MARLCTRERPARGAIGPPPPPKYTGLTKAWLDQYERLKQFYRKHGHSNVPQRYPADRALGAWVGRQRGSTHARHMTEERRQLLNEVEFCWELQSGRFDRLWNESYKKLEEFKAKHGHCNVPQLYDREKRRSLGMWISMQRVQYHRGVLSQDRKRKLDELGFIFERDKRYIWGEDRDIGRQELMWLKNYEALVDFYRTYGHTLVPNLFVGGRAECLGRWVRSQRSNYLQKILPDSRREQLENIGFVWIVLARGHVIHSDRIAWLKMYSRLVEYRKIHGDSLVRSDYSQDKELARWVEEQRSGLKDGSVVPRRIERLDAIGFLMTKKKYAQYWNRQFKNLVSYQRTHGTTVVGHPTEGRLLRWTTAQRYLYQNKILSKEHQRKLESIGFDWRGQSSSCERVRISSNHSRKDRTTSSEDEWSSDKLSDDDSVLQDSEPENSNDGVRSTQRKLVSRRDRETEIDATISVYSSQKRRRGSSRTSGRSAQAEGVSNNRGVDSGELGVPGTNLQISHEAMADQSSPNASICGAVDNGERVDRQLPTLGVAERSASTRDRSDSPVFTRPECNLHEQADQENRNSEPSGGLYSVCDSIDDRDDARERVDCSVLYPIGTRVRKYYDCYGWVSGEIAQFEGLYRVRYEDGDEEDFVADDKELEAIVLQAQSKGQPTSCSTASILTMGTPVSKHFPGYGWFAGQIIAFDGLYLVRHDDGDEEELFYDSPEVTRIVSNATDNP